MDRLLALLQHGLDDESSELTCADFFALIEAKSPNSRFSIGSSFRSQGTKRGAAISRTEAAESKA